MIPTGYTGVKTVFGQISNKTLTPGLHFTIPIAEKIVLVNNKQQDIYFSGQIWGESAERTTVYAQDVTITYKITPEKSFYLFANVTGSLDNLVSSDLVSSAIKTAMKEISVENITSRSVIEAASKEKLNGALVEKFGEGAVLVLKVTISQMDFEDSYNEAIARKQIAQQEYETTLIENQTKMEKAEAEAEALLIKSRSEAEALLIKSNAEAEANSVLNSSLKPNVLEYLKIQKWDGVLPKVTDGNAFLSVE